MTRSNKRERYRPPGDRSSKTPSNFLTEQSPESLVSTATDHLRVECSPAAALGVVNRALEQNPNFLPAIELVGEIYLEWGEIGQARSWFEKAVALDPQGAHEDLGGSGPEKFLWLAQLCENGGKEAVGWYERGVRVLRTWINDVENISGMTEEILESRGLKRKLCSALCGMAEIYMTDLCLEPDAEEHCERFVTEALLVVPDSAEALQTLASIRISQNRIDDARAALERSIALWRNYSEPGSPTFPSYSSRMAATRLLMETDMYDTAFAILEELQEEDDEVVDLWYLGGWCLYCQGEKLREEEQVAAAGQMGKGSVEEDEEQNDDWQSLWQMSREWLNKCVELYKLLEWDDEQLEGHAIEILSKIMEVLGENMEGDEGEGDDGGEDGWESADSEEAGEEVDMDICGG